MSFTYMVQHAGWHGKGEWDEVEADGWIPALAEYTKRAMSAGGEGCEDVAYPVRIRNLTEYGPWIYRKLGAFVPETQYTNEPMTEEAWKAEHGGEE